MQDFSLCPRFEEAMGILGKRWTGLIIEVLASGGCTRFSDITQAIPHVSDRMVAERLRELEASGLLERNVYPETPVRIEYRLTQKGLALKPVLDAVHDWANQWVDSVPVPST